MINPVPRGSKVGIVSPSSALDSPEDIRDGLRWLESCGYRVVLGTHVYDRLNHMAGTPEQQAEDLMRFFADPEIRAVFAAAGGFGAQYLLPLLDYDLIRKNPKPLIGFSDTTALQAGIFARTGNVCYAGILLKYDFGRGASVHPYTAESFLRAMDGRFEDIRGGTVVNPGTAEGRLVGTNLCVLQSLAGTPYYPDLTDTILLLEDVDEKSYRIERMLLQLRQQPSFARMRGVVFGQFTDIRLNHPDDKDVNRVIDEFAAAVKIPVIRNFPFGHVRARKTVPLGARVTLDAGSCILKIKD